MSFDFVSTKLHDLRIQFIVDRCGASTELDYPLMQ